MIGNGIKVDQRISVLLQELGIDYETDSDGDFQAVYQLGENRFQQFVISSSTKHVSDLEIRNLYSVGYKSVEPLSHKVANLLLGINHGSKLGAWQVMESEGDYYAAYNAQISANSDAQTLLTVIKAVVESADSIEDYLTGEDIF